MKLVKLVLARPAATGRMSALTAAMEKRMRRVVWRMVPEAAQAAACNPLNAVPRSQPAGYMPSRGGVVEGTIFKAHPASRSLISLPRFV
jgi:hypothetical protein